MLKTPLMISLFVVVMRLLILFFIARWYYNLAKRYERNTVAYPVIAIIAYFTGSISSSFIIGLIFEAVSPGLVATVDRTLLSFLFIPFGLLYTYLLYDYLEKRFRDDDGGNKPPGDLLDADLINKNP